MYVAYAIVRAVALSAVAALLAMLAVGSLLRSTASPASVRPGAFCTLRFSADLDRRCKLLLGAGVAFCVLCTPFIPFGFGEGWWAFPIMVLAIRRRLIGYALHLDTKRLWQEPLRDGARTLYWARLASVRLAGHWLVLTDVFKSQVRVSRFLGGLGSLALHIDDHAPGTTQIDGRARALLLDRYRQGLVEAGENPGKWFAEHGGPLTAFVKQPGQPQDDGQGVLRVRNHSR
jgi:hypothetical protein